MNQVWTGLEHLIWKNFKECGLENNDQFILAVSGGVDSMVLLNVFLKLKPQAQIKVAYFHHGVIASEPKIDQFRKGCYELVKHKIYSLNKKNIEFFSEQSKELLRSEEEMRNARWRFLRNLKSESDVLVTAHHLNDRLETILLKLIRGSSLEGISQFKMWNSEIFRPFLNISKSELMSYAKEHHINWIEDYMRNWIRHKWLVDLDQKITGGSSNLGRSLVNIVESSTQSQSLKLVFATSPPDNSLSRQWYVSLSKFDQVRGLALFLKTNKITDFTTGQLEEIRKRLDKNQKDITFEILGRKWVINATQIMLE